jgi:hypothetical protein
MMVTRAAGHHQRQIKEEQAEELLANQQVEYEHQQHLQEKKWHTDEQKKEEEWQTKMEEEIRKAPAAEAAATAQVVSPSKSGQQDRADPAINDHLASMMQGEKEVKISEKDERDVNVRDVTQSPIKNKQKKSYVETATTAAPPAVKAKNVWTSFDSHIYKHQRVIVEASIKLTGANPMQEFIVNLQELLKNGQLVDKYFAFSPVKPDRGEKKIHEPSGVPTNMTMLGAHFKISSNGKNPFKKQKAWGNKAKKDKEEFRDSIVYFSLAIPMDEDPEELLPRIIHEWQHRGGILLKIKELQSFKSKMVLSLFNIYTAVPKKFILDKLLTILAQAQSFAQEEDFSEFNWDADDLLNNSTLPAMEIHLQNPKLPRLDTSN